MEHQGGIKRDFSKTILKLEGASDMTWQQFFIDLGVFVFWTTCVLFNLRVGALAMKLGGAPKYVTRTLDLKVVCILCGPFLTVAMIVVLAFGPGYKGSLALIQLIEQRFRLGSIWFTPKKILVLSPNPDDFYEISAELFRRGITPICMKLSGSGVNTPLTAEILDAMFVGGDRRLGSGRLGKGGLPIVSGVFAPGMGDTNTVCDNLDIPHVILGSKTGQMSVSEGVDHIAGCITSRLQRALELKPLEA